MSGGWNWIDKTGMKFGKLTAIEYLGERKWKCQCDCGNITTVDSSDLPISGKRRGTKSCGCNIGKLSKNNNYFNNIDDENKAYILGLMCSDGNVWSGNKSYFWKIRLQKQDEDILHKIKTAVESKVTIKYQNDITLLPTGNKIQTETASLQICNKENVLDLIKYGIIPNKTHNLHFDFSCIDKSLYRHFFRGVYDGDGTFGVYRSKAKTGGWHYETMLTGFYDFLKDCKEKIEEEFPDMSLNLYHAKGCAEDIYRLSTNKKNNMYNLFEWLYKDSTIYLNRKYEKYKKIKEKYYIKNSND